MRYLNIFSDFLGSVAVPVVLCVAAVFLFPNVIKVLRCGEWKNDKQTGQKTKKFAKKTPFQALTLALAGTLGVGNITGVASALTLGGPGSVFWMCLGAVLVLPVKYAEVFLALRFRKRGKNSWYGGAMYYIRDGLIHLIGKKYAAALGGGFAIFCCANSLITGTILQANAAATVFPKSKQCVVGILLAALLSLSITYGVSRIEKITVKIIPILAGFYILVSLYVIVTNISYLPSVIADICRSAFTPKAVLGSAAGIGVREAFRLGLIRGILSNEAGCGTSPTAHASADTDDPKKQAGLGVVEVVVDTLVLCSLTAFVMLISNAKYNNIPFGQSIDAAPLALHSFEAVTGEVVYYLLTASIVLFAFSTILAQLFYGTAAIRYLTNKKSAIVVYNVASLVCTVLGSVISAPILWFMADTLIGTMTVINGIVLILLRKYCSVPITKESRPPDDRR